MLDYVNDIGVRAVKTSIQVFAAQVAASGLGILEFVGDASTLQKAGLAAASGGLSVLWNALVNWSSK